MSEYTGQPQSNPLDDYVDQVRQLHGFTDGLGRYPGAIWPANNPVGTEYTQGMGNPSGPFVPAPSGRIDTAEHIMSLPGADLATGFVLGVDAGGNPLRVYHGTPHTFSPVEGNPLGAFDPARIGSGEGAQAYGHGLYVAENEGVAQGYRDSLTRPVFTSPSGETMNIGDLDHHFAQTALQASPDLRQRQADMISRNVTQFLQTGRLDEAERMLAEAEHLSPEARAGWGAAIDRAKEFAVTRPTGRMYEAEFHASPDELLDWDKPLSQQSPKVQQALAGLGIKAPEIGTRQLDNGKWVVDYTDQAGKPATSSRQFDDQPTAQLYGRETMKIMGRDPTGAQIYESSKLVPGDYRNSPAASDALHGGGIKGIRYMDAGSRNVMVRQNSDGQWAVQQTSPGMKTHYSKHATPEEAEATADSLRSHNYVVFDPSTLNIVRRYGIGAVIGGGAAAGAAQQQ